MKRSTLTGFIDTKEGLKFHFEFYPSGNKRCPLVIYFPGISGKRVNHLIASSFAGSGFDFFSFDFFDPPPRELSKKEMVAYLNIQRESWSLMFPVGGKRSAGQSIVDNEISAAIRFLGNSGLCDRDRGYYLIGGSFGHWLALLTIREFPGLVKGTTFLSPALIPEMLLENADGIRFDREGYFCDLTEDFDIPAAAVGDNSDIIADFLSERSSSMDGVKILKTRIKGIEALDVRGIGLHSKELLSPSDPSVMNFIKGHIGSLV